MKDGATVTMEAGDYDTLTLNSELTGVTIVADDGVVIDNIALTSDAVLEDVTLTGFDFTCATGTGNGVIVDAGAAVDNLVIENCTFTGNNTKTGRGLDGYNAGATITIKGCTFKDMGYPIYAWGSYDALIIDGCTFDNIKSWAVMPQSGFDGDLTVTNCEFKNCIGGGLIKAGTLTAGHTFTFTDNTVTGCTVAGDHNWFQFNVSAGSKVISGNTKDGVAWTPVKADGLTG